MSSVERRAQALGIVCKQMGLEIPGAEKIRQMPFGPLLRNLEAVKKSGITALVSCRKDLRADGDRVVQSSKMLQLALQVEYSGLALRFRWTPPVTTCPLARGRMALALLDEVDHAGRTALQRAAGTGAIHVVREYIGYGVDIEACGGDNRQTSLIKAAQNGHEGVVKALIAARAKVNAREPSGDTALIHASWIGHMGMVRQLIAARADIDAQGAYGQTALMRAAPSGHVANVQFLLEQMADPTLLDDAGYNALVLTQMVASPAVGRHQAVVELLSNWGKSVVS
jgi:hypothetical protein